MDQQDNLDLLEAGLFVPGQYDNPFVDKVMGPELPEVLIVECCGKDVHKCKCSSTSTKEDEYIFTGSICNIDEFADTKHVMHLVQPVPYQFFCTDFTCKNVAAEFIRFIVFIWRHPKPGKSELKPLILPVTVHLYAIMIERGAIGAEEAKTFINLDLHILRHLEDYKDTLDALRFFENSGELKQSPYFQDFFERRIVIQMSEEVFQSLQNFLRTIKKVLGESILLPVFHYNIYFEKNGVYFRDKNNKNGNGESSGECKKNQIDAGGKMEVEHEDSNLKTIEISKIIIYSTKVGECFKIYDLDSEEVIVIDDTFKYPEPKKKSKTIKVIPARERPLRLRVSPRLVSTNKNRFGAVKPTVKQCKVKVNPIPEKVIEVERKLPFKSLHYVDFNSAMTEMAYAIGDTYIYTLPITTPKKKTEMTTKFIKNMTVNLKTIHHDESNLKATKDPENKRVYVVKYLPRDAFHLLVVCTATVRLLNTQTGIFLAEYVTDGSFVYDVDIDCLGENFATANHYHEAYIYSFKIAKRICMLTGHKKAVTCIKFHPNGIYIATGSEDCAVRLYEVETGMCVRVFVGHLFGITHMDFSHDGHFLACADSSGLVNVWDIKDCAVLSKMAMRVDQEIHSFITSLCFHDKCFILAASNEKGEVLFWDVRNPEDKQVLRTVKKPVKIKRREGWNIVYTLNPESETARPKKK